MRTRHLAALAVLTAATTTGLAAGCGDDDDDGPDDVALSDDAQITYHFGDSSVPPEFHRSYTLTIDATEVHAVVDSYGDVLEDVTEELPAEVWDGLVAGAGTVALLDPSDDDEGCAGGTSREIEITDGDDTVAASAFSVCGGANEDTARTLDAYVQPVLDAIPNWDDLVAT
jgi:hypothetical protein